MLSIIYLYNSSKYQSHDVPLKDDLDLRIFWIRFSWPGTGDSPRTWIPRHVMLEIRLKHIKSY